jgi:hypothetical protein
MLGVMSVRESTIPNEHDFVRGTCLSSPIFASKSKAIKKNEGKTRENKTSKCIGYIPDRYFTYPAMDCKEFLNITVQPDPWIAPPGTTIPRFIIIRV